MRLRSLALSLLVLFSGACQKYSPSRLKLASYQLSIQGRDISAPAVVTYAKKLARSTMTAPVAYDPADGLSLEEAEVVALFFNPELRLARLRANVPRVVAAEAGRWADPELAVDGERIIESIEHPWVLGGMLRFTIPLSGRLGVERQRALADVTSAEFRVLVEGRRVLFALRSEWVEWSASRERAELGRQIVDELKQVVGRGDRLRDAGELDPIDARLLRLEMLRQTADVRRHEADALARQLRLKSRLGLVADANVQLIPAVNVRRHHSDSSNDPTTNIMAHPRVRLLEAEYAAAEQALHLEITRQYPDLNVGAGYGEDEGNQRIQFGLSLPLPLFSANRGAIAQARAERDVARASAEAQFESLLAEVAEAQVRLDAATGRVRYVNEELAPLADQQVENARRLGAAGEFNTLILLEAIKTAHEAKLQVLDARVDAALAENRIAELLSPKGATAEEDQP